MVASTVKCPLFVLQFVYIYYIIRNAVPALNIVSVLQCPYYSVRTILHCLFYTVSVTVLVFIECLHHICCERSEHRLISDGSLWSHPNDRKFEI